MSGLIVMLCVGTQITTSTYAQYRTQAITDQATADATESSGLFILLGLVGIVAAVALVWRHRWPVWILLSISALTVALPLDAITPLFALYAVVLAVSGPWLWASIALATAAEFASVWRDGTGTQVSSWARSMFSMEDGAAFPWWLMVLETVVFVAVTVGLAMLVRSRKALRASEVKEVRSETKLHALGEEVARQAERERIAREVHDVLGHRLSLLSLHASGLELAADDPKLVKSAALVREGAQESMADLRSLLAVLRQPSDPDISQTLPSLIDLPQLIDESLAAGSPVAAAVFLDRGAELHDQVSRAAYRITQELLTNARRHAPGAPVRLQIDGGPDRGVQISTANRAPDPTDRAIRPGNGLTGMHERVQQAGGESWVWVDDEGAFRTLVRLPWHSRGTSR
ncbi:two-component sensor histidine kinase [Flexivirga endophytica]|uniref:histidine kinase n=1 Tax=Flexivirga endophytica TaxID=1849103 RepID=A0A916T241_9MICO|nr:two-component sensor histidine kinase [Flexivirga endophytica]GHB62434.1 two-component sensor histidine kinase [Flexivirga endophytica]